jgi:hypothetical protein
MRRGRESTDSIGGIFQYPSSIPNLKLEKLADFQQNTSGEGWTFTDVA